MRKQILAAALAVGMAVTALAGCGNGNTAQTSETTAAPATEAATTAAPTTSAAEENGSEAQTEAAEETDGLPADYFAGTELNIYAKLGNEVDTDYNKKLIFQMAEEATGIHVNWTVLSADAWSEQVNLLLASGNLPDAFVSDVGESAIRDNMELFYDLSEEGLLETYVPNLLETIPDVYPNGLDALRWPDGSIRSLPTGRPETDYQELKWLPMINKRWLERVNMDMPTTADELYEVLCAFRDQDANGNGDPNDEIPFGFAEQKGNVDIEQSMNYFGIANTRDGIIGHYKMIKDGVVTPTANTPEMRAWLEYMHKLMAEGLLDPEGFSQTGDEWTAKVSQDLYGVTYMFSPVHQGLNFDDWEFLWVQGLEGVEPVLDGIKYYDTTHKTEFAISAKSENVPALLHWYNWLASSRELKMIGFLGDPGVLWDEYEGEIYLNDDWKKDPKYEGETASTLTGSLGKNCVLLSVKDYAYDDRNTHIVDGVPTVLEFDPTDSTQGRVKLVKEYLPLAQDEYILPKFEDPDVVGQRKFIETDLTPMISNFVATSIMEGVTDESWDTFLKNLETYGYYDWIEWYQNSYDGNF